MTHTWIDEIQLHFNDFELFNDVDDDDDDRRKTLKFNTRIDPMS